MAIESKHTPGPWTAVNAPDFVLDGITMIGGWEVVGPHPALDVRFKNEADARAIAAVPEMMEALEAFLADDDRPRDTRILRAALAKANGGK